MTEAQIITRLRQLESEADVLANDLVRSFSDDYKGKVMFALMIAKSVKGLCAITPGFQESTFIADVKTGARIWVEAGEPQTKAEGL